MRVAVLARLHANLPALEAVLDDLAGQEYAALWCIGDWVTHGPYPDAVVERLRPLCTLGVLGAGDVAVLNCAEVTSEAEEALSPVCWTYQRLNKEQRRYLRLLSSSARFQLGGRHFLLTQSVDGVDEGMLRPDAPGEFWLRLFQQAQAEVLLVSSGGEAFVQSLGEALCINLGAAGATHAGRAEASYALLDISDAAVQVEFRRVPYPIGDVWEACREQGIPLFPPLFVESADSVPPPEPFNHPHEEETLSDRRLVPVLDLARLRGDGDEAHWFAVSRLALQLFDQLQSLHHFGRQERFWLECAALLHTLERGRHPRKYPRRALRTILKTPLLPFDARERLLIGSLVRYQQERPRKKHQNYALLKPEERNVVQILAAILRLAIALAEAQPPVEEVYGTISPRKLKLRLLARASDGEAAARAKRRGKRLARLFGRKLRVTCLPLDLAPDDETHP